MIFTPGKRFSSRPFFQSVKVGPTKPTQQEGGKKPSPFPPPQDQPAAVLLRRRHPHSPDPILPPPKLPPFPSFRERNPSQPPAVSFVSGGRVADLARRIGDAGRGLGDLLPQSAGRRPHQPPLS